MKSKSDYSSVSFLRMICMICIVFVSYSFTGTAAMIIRIFLNFSTGTLFLLDGFFALRDDGDLKEYIKYTAKIFGILFGVYFVLACVQSAILNGNPFKFITFQAVIDFLLLNYWQPTVGTTIWIAQSTLYALVIFWIFRKLKNLDWLFCIITFAISTVLGEGAKFLDFSFFGHEYISGNFLTRAIPYMLLGRLMYKSIKKLSEINTLGLIVAFCCGALFAYSEIKVLQTLGKLVYINHLLGFIVMSVSAVLLALHNINFPESLFLREYSPLFGKWLYFAANPLAEFLLILNALFIAKVSGYVSISKWIGVIVILIIFVSVIIVNDIFLKKGKEEALKYNSAILDDDD